MKYSIAFAVGFALQAMGAPTPDGGASGQAPTRPFTYMGISESGAENSPKNPDVGPLTAQDFPATSSAQFPDTNKVDALIADGFNLVRIMVRMEYMVPSTTSPPRPTGTLDPTYMTSLESLVTNITNKNAKAVICPWNYGRYYGQTIAPADFTTFWKTVAQPFATNTGVIFDTNNEYHDHNPAYPNDIPSMSTQDVLNLNEAAISGIRAAGASTQTIFVEGTAYTGASDWSINNGFMSAISDPNVVFEMHLYFDSSGGGSNADCNNDPTGIKFLTGSSKPNMPGPTDWLRTNGKKGIIGEFAAGTDSTCTAAVSAMLKYLGQNNDVWEGAVWWGGGHPGVYYDFEPPVAGSSASAAYTTYMPIFQNYLGQS